MNSPEHQNFLDELAARLSKQCTKKELCQRIAEAWTQQDSCGKCESLNIKARLEGKFGYYLICTYCQEEFDSEPSEKSKSSLKKRK